ncbi:uracilDNA glycosylase, putative, partial [Acanthamoeba castellanii str. Neff]
SWAKNKGVVQSGPAKQLLLLSLLHKNGRLSRSQLTTLKDLVVERNDSVGYVVQVFELMDDDFDELEDNLKHLCKYEEERRAEEGTVARPSMAAAHQGGGAFSFASSSPPPAGQFALSAEAGGLTELGWLRHLGPEFAKPYFRSLLASVAAERQAHTVYPPEESVYSAFNYTPLDQVKVVILGQDPYFNENQAHGLSFSVTRGVAVPPSLKKIYAELERSIPGWRRPNHGCLTEWAQRGVLLLNATYTLLCRTS